MAQQSRDFGFPFQPWPLQKDFMNSLYQALDRGVVGVFESPTGTGKSLSLICGALTWMKAKRQTGDLIVEESGTDQQQQTVDDEPDWIKQHLLSQKAQAKDRLVEVNLRHRRKIQDQIEAERQNMTRVKDEKSTKRQRLYSKSKRTVGDEDDFLIDCKDPQQEMIDRILKEVEMEKQSRRPEDSPAKETKIIYTSRTHSQISQFVKEIKKTKFIQEVRVVSLGSRKQLCIHEDIQRMKSVNAMNDACLDMQQGPKSGKCPYLVQDHDQSNRLIMSIFTDVHDIEDIANIGSRQNVCPYYGTRNAMQEADIITLPYNLLFSKSARESLKLDIQGHVIIVDEAHNIMDTINDLYSASLSLLQVKHTKMQMQAYLKHYEKKLAPRNVVFLKQLIHFMGACEQFLQVAKNASKAETIPSMNDFMHRLDIDNLNLFDLSRYLSESKLAQKLHGFTELQEHRKKVKEQKENRHELKQSLGDDEVKESRHSRVFIHQVEQFLLCLTNPDVDGKLYVDIQAGDACLSFMLLNPAGVFEEVVAASRSVILAGGTMEPLSELKKQLIPNISPERFFHFSCDHIVPPSNVNVVALSQGIQQPLNFTFGKRGDAALIKDLGNSVCNFCNVIPGGVILFFPSYSYLESVQESWKSQEILSRIQKRKRVFIEPKQSNMVDQVLAAYSDCILKAKSSTDGGLTGAIMFCVVGGKLSEGINFSDDLGRGVIMVGLPFASLYSIEIQEKMKYYNEKYKDENAGNEFYENMCMKAVNQSIGRAIRHKNDYACILLLDARYHQPKISNKLPGWIKNSGVQNISNFGEALRSVSKFFKGIHAR